MIGTKSRQFLIFLALLGISCVSLAETPTNAGHEALDKVAGTETSGKNSQDNQAAKEFSGQIGHSGGVPRNAGTPEDGLGDIAALIADEFMINNVITLRNSYWRGGRRKWGRKGYPSCPTNYSRYSTFTYKYSTTSSGCRGGCTYHYTGWGTRCVPDLTGLRNAVPDLSDYR